MSYKTKAFIGVDKDGYPQHTADEVIVTEHQDVFTGIYDQNGQKIYRSHDRHPMGFTNGKPSG